MLQKYKTLKTKLLNTKLFNVFSEFIKYSAVTKLIKIHIDTITEKMMQIGICIYYVQINY